MDGTFKPRGDKMNDTTKRELVARAAPRNPTEAAVTCQPYASSETIYTCDGVMRNFSSEGSYIETSHNFKPGTILIVRMLRYPTMTSSIPDDARPRSFSLAEVKWRQELDTDNDIRYGIGLRYFD